MIENQVATAGGTGLLGSSPQSLTERLVEEKSRLELRLSDIDAIISRLKENPEMQNVLDSLARLGHSIY